MPQARPKQSTRPASSFTRRTHLINDLAEAIGNQVNNLMMAVTGYAELAAKKAAPQEKRGLEQLLRNSSLAAMLVQKVLALSRRSDPSPQAISLNPAIAEAGDLLQHLIGEEIEFIFSPDPNAHMVELDRAEFDQLLMSLALDVREGLRNGGKLTLSTKRVDREFSSSTQNVKSGKFVELSVCAAAHDNTHVPATDPRTGFAFSIARTIARRAGGYMRAGSEPGIQFQICFPALDADATVTKLEGPNSSARTILVVEDDDNVRLPTAEFLMMEGFKVMQARTGAEAIRVATNNRSPLDLLITDIVMPTMSGHQVADELIKMHPGLKVLYMSGDSGEVAPARVHGSMERTVLQKPFRLSRLKEAVQETLG